MKLLATNPSNLDYQGANRARGANSRFVQAVHCYYWRAEIRASGSQPDEKAASARAFRKIGRDYWHREANIAFAAELALFAIVTLVAAWPVAMACRAIAFLQ